jgi:hypothetical protein
LTDTAAYSLQASNALGVVSSTASQFTVNAAPDPVDGVVGSLATQTGFGSEALFIPTWTVSTNNLIAGVTPSNVGVGDFSADGWGSIALLTDSKAGRLNSPGNGSPDFVTAGINNGTATFGPSVTYTLTGSATGYDLTNIVVYGGWSEGNHDQQKYTILYSTVASPTTFNQLAGVDFNPALPGQVQSATRVTLTATNGVLAKNVAAVKLDFNILQPPVVEGGYAGYAEIGLSGVPSVPAPVVAANISPLGGSDVVGSTVTFTAAFTSQTPVTYQWRVDSGSGPVNIPNATNTTLTLSNLQLTDSGSYSLQASNASGATITSASPFVVSPVPDPDVNGVIASPANQYGASPFATTWTVNTNSLIAGQLPTGVGAGRFTREGAIGGPKLTDGSFGTVGGSIESTATAGNGNGGCTSAIYTLATGSSSGYTITNITVYAGWNDGGRDQQAYTLKYSTVDAPDTFIDLAAVSYNPSVPGSTPTADRVTIRSSTGGLLATNVARVQFDWSTPDTENGYAGYTEIGIFGSPSPAISYAPFVRLDVTPTTCSDVVGSQVTFKAAFTANPAADYRWKKDGSYISGSTSTTLTLVNLQDGDVGSYSLEASNALGIAETSASTLTAVNAVPAPENNIIASIASQTGVGNGRLFDPTWAIAPGSLIAGQSPSSTTGNFVNLDGNGGSTGGTGVLTDGNFDQINTPGGATRSLAAGGGGQGQTATYTLTGSATGYDLTNIVVYGGWSDGGRDAQAYTIYYSTVSAPTTFIQLRNLSSNPSLPGSVQSAQRVTFTSSTAGPIAANVAAVKFDFTTPSPENGWTGYGELALFGMPSVPLNLLTIGAARITGGNLILTGSGGTPNGGYTLLTSTNVTASLSTWTTNGTGVFSGSGSFSNAIPVNPLEAVRFFTIRIP